MSKLQPPSSPRSRPRPTAVAALVLAACAFTLFTLHPTLLTTPPTVPAADLTLCPQQAALHPAAHADINSQLEEIYRRATFKREVAAKLGGAIRVRTESYDDLKPVGQDARWSVFGEFHDYLALAYPNVFGKLNVTKVNTYALVLHWQGSDPSLKPLLLTAHQDVVPVEPATVSEWIQPPYSGNYDGTWIWGRGSVDDKSDLISQLETINALLRKKFQPARSIVLAFGIDEEASGVEGAGHIAQYLEKKYGRDSFAMLVDEGDGYSEPSPGVMLAFPNTAEKGYLDVRIEVSTPGGHSSVPPKHTSIGMLARAIVALEDHPHTTRLTRDSTAFGSVQCLAEYSPAFPAPLKQLVQRALTSDAALAQLKDALLDMDPVAASTLGTTQAVDIIQAGVKVNALPEKAAAVVNHRIADYSSVKALQEHLGETLLPVAQALNLSMRAFGEALAYGVAGDLVMSEAYGSALEPAPVTPTDEHDAPWQVLAGTIRAALVTSHVVNASTVAVGPSLSIGNTDTKSYWNLTRHIFRYSHKTPGDVYAGIHTVNEAMRADGLIEQIRFFTKLILNVDESRSL